MVPIRLIRLLDDAGFAELITVVFVTFVMVVVVVVTVWLRIESVPELFELAELLLLAVLYVRDFSDELVGGGVEHVSAADDDAAAKFNLSATCLDFNGDKQK